MKIQFVKEPDCWIALAFNEVFDEMVVEEAWWAEIYPSAAGVIVRWESDYNNPVTLPSFDGAKTYILHNYQKYTPTLIGKRWEVDEL